MRKIIGLILVLFVSVVCFAQPGKVDVETLNGKKYYVHFIESGQTLYGLHQMYDVPVGDIARANNDLTDGLQIGQKILIPISISNPNYYQQYVVLKGETLYGISKKHKCSVSDLKIINPELVSEGISIGQVLKVPTKNVDLVTSSKIPSGEMVIEDPIELNPVSYTENVSPFKDSIIIHTVLKHETLYSVSKRYMVSINSIKELNDIKHSSVNVGDKLKIKVKKVNYSIVENKIETPLTKFDTSLTYTGIYKKEKYKVALFLPLMLSRNQSYLDKPIKVGKVKELYSITNIASEFYHGFVLAADSLAKAGLDVDIYVYDTQKDTLKIQKHLDKPEFHDVDLVVGPLFSKTINYLASYCKVNNIPMVIPFKTSSKVLYQNPNIFKATTSNLSLSEGIGEYTAKQMSHYKVFMVKPTKKSDLVLYEKVMDAYNVSIKAVDNPMSSKIIELKVGDSGGRDINVHLRKDTVNVIIVPSTDVKFVTDVFTRLNNVLNLNTYSKNMSIVVFGLEDWNKMNDIDLKHRVRLKQCYATYRFTDYEAPKTTALIKSYRTKYGTDPEVYGIQGFDVGYYFLSALYLYGENFKNYISEYELETIQNDFRFPKNMKGDGIENYSIKIIQYSNYDLKLKN
jgi:LysM repeat protein